MTQEKDDYLVNKYPKIFVDRYSDMKTTCMCWGFEMSDGWCDLIDNLCENIQNYLDKNPNVDQVIAVQVKEKFGGLRFYVDGGDKFTDNLISEAENLSYKTCEYCGSTENVTQTGNWIKSLCSNCIKKK